MDPPGNDAGLGNGEDGAPDGDPGGFAGPAKECSPGWRGGVRYRADGAGPLLILLVLFARELTRELGPWLSVDWSAGGGGAYVVGGAALDVLLPWEVLSTIRHTRGWRYNGQPGGRFVF
jgi:hypothetical protein